MAPTERPDWRREEITAFARRMLSECEPCRQGCKAMVCGKQEKEAHDEFHKILNDTQKDREALRNRLDLLETKMTDGQSNLDKVSVALNSAQKTLGLVQESITGLANRVSTVETKQADNERRIASLEVNVSNILTKLSLPGGIIK